MEKAINQILLDNNVGGKGRFFRTRFLQPGLVKYSFGVCLLEKETIDKFVYDFTGCPVIINHKDVTEESAKDDRVGVISRVEYNQFDGWYWGEGVIFEQDALDLIDKGYNVSCQYEITEYSSTGGIHNGNKYDKVILNGRPEHLAIVKNPRYENALISINSIEVDEMIAENEEKKEFVTVGEGESAHAIPVDYMEKDKINYDYFKTYKFNELVDYLYDNGLLNNEWQRENKKAKNGWITQKEGVSIVDDDGVAHELVRHIWIEESVQPSEWKKWNKSVFANYKEGDETKFEFGRTRAKISNEHQALVKNTLKEFMQKYKFNTPASITVMGLEEGCMGLCASRHDTSTVTLSPMLFSGKYTQKQYDESVKAGFHPKGTGDMVKRVLVHELGHSITVHNSNDKKFWNEIVSVRNDYMENIKPTDVKNPDFISNYARVNYHEFVAEAFCQGILSKESGKYTKKVMEIIDKYYSKNNQLKLALNESDESDEKDEKENDHVWIENFCGGYPIDEKTYKKMKDKQKSKAKAKNDIIQAINELKDNNMFKNLFKKKENKMDKDEMKDLFMECLTELTASNEKEEEKEDKTDWKKLYNDLKAEVEAKEKEKDDKEEKEDVVDDKEKENIAENKCDKAKNEIDAQKEQILGTKVESKIEYITEKRAKELGKQLF